MNNMDVKTINALEIGQVVSLDTGYMSFKCIIEGPEDKELLKTLFLPQADWNGEIFQESYFPSQDAKVWADLEEYQSEHVCLIDFAMLGGKPRNSEDEE